MFPVGGCLNSPMAQQPSSRNGIRSVRFALARSRRKKDGGVEWVCATTPFIERMLFMSPVSSSIKIIIKEAKKQILLFVCFTLFVSICCCAWDCDCDCDASLHWLSTFDFFYFEFTVALERERHFCNCTQRTNRTTKVKVGEREQRRRRDGEGVKSSACVFLWGWTDLMCGNLKWNRQAVCFSQPISFFQSSTESTSVVSRFSFYFSFWLSLFKLAASQ